MRGGAHATLALQRFDQNAGGVRADRFLDCFEIAERHLIEAIHRWPKAFVIFWRPARNHRRHRPAMKRAVVDADAITLPFTVGIVMPARHRYPAYSPPRT